MNNDSLFEATKQLVNDLIAYVIQLAPSIILATVVFIIGLVLAWLTKKMIRNFILYLDQNINLTLKDRLLTVDLKGSALFIARTFYWIIIILTVTAVTYILGLPVITAWFGGLITYLPNIVAAVVIIFTGIIGGKLAGDLVASAATKAGMPKGIQLGKFVQYIFLIISILIAVDQIGIDIHFLTVMLTIFFAVLLFGAALAFGLGAQTSISNILGSYYVQKTYQVGNTVKIGNIEGVIVRITPTAVFIETESG
jgi:hypothetical protein